MGYGTDGLCEGDIFVEPIRRANHRMRTMDILLDVTVGH